MEKKPYKTIEYAREGNIARIIFNRPEVHNAFNSLMISELDDVVEKVMKNPSIRIVILSGRGKSF